ncbi:MAG: phospholipid carrier-dependent glycosyltransferase [Deltaproteobacteria bacterium]|nr:phospholipid carrier-dependent glycosyltransferase [Deltaproteobacteria bacterium]
MIIRMIGTLQAVKGRRPGPVFFDLPTTIAWSSLFFLSLAVCLVFVFSYPPPDVKYDAAEYLALSRSVAAGTGFSQDGGVTPAVYRPPLFSLLLGGWFHLTGTSSVLSVAVFQSLLHAFGVLAAFALFLQISLSLRWAIGGALFLAVNPLLVTRVVFVYQETTLVLFTTLAVLASVRLVRRSSGFRAGLAGAAWGACTLAKIVCWFAPFLLLAMRFLPSRLRWDWRRKEAALLLLLFVVVIAPWTVRNYVRFHRFIPVNGQGEGILEWNVSHATIAGEPPGDRYVAEVYGKNLSERERKDLLWRYIGDHPRYFLVDRVIRNIVHFAAPPRDWWIARGYFRPGEHRTSFWILAGLFHIPLYLFLLYRTWQWGAGKATPAYGVFLLFYWFYWAEHALVWGDPRFGLAVYPLLVVMVLPLRWGEEQETGRLVTEERERGPG